MKVNMDKAQPFATRRSWRAWLRKNHNKEQELWLIYYKKHTGKPTVSYNDSVEEALCFGWIDGITQRIDEERYALRFTPRRNGSAWSQSNIARMKKLQELGLLSKAAIVPTPETKVVPPRQIELPIPDELQTALRKNTKARRFFNSLAPSYRRLYVRWISSAKQDSTRLRRVNEAVALLAAGKKLPMK
jgi:uncharacterized protein YdeI (YjbR/CyaY-like superfamily)